MSWCFGKQVVQETLLSHHNAAVNEHFPIALVPVTGREFVSQTESVHIECTCLMVFNVYIKPHSIL